GPLGPPLGPRPERPLRPARPVIALPLGAVPGSALPLAATCCPLPVLVVPATVDSPIDSEPAPLAAQAGPPPAVAALAPGFVTSTYFTTSLGLPPNSTKPIVRPKASATATAIHAAFGLPPRFGTMSISSTTAGPVT